MTDVDNGHGLRPGMLSPALLSDEDREEMLQDRGELVTVRRRYLSSVELVRAANTIVTVFEYCDDDDIVPFHNCEFALVHVADILDEMIAGIDAVLDAHDRARYPGEPRDVRVEKGGDTE